MSPKTRLAALSLLLGAWLPWAACKDATPTAPVVVPAPGATQPVAAPAASELPADAALAPWRVELLQLAFDTASAMPLAPHVKNRARAQAAVIAACLRLDQPRRAAEWLRAIPNWQRGLCAADLAVWCARRGTNDAVGALLEQAEDVARQVLADPKEQGWRAERIRSRCAEAILLLDETTRQALSLPPGGHEALLAEIDKVLAAGDLEKVSAVLAQCTELFAQHYRTEARRAQAEERIRNARVPATVRLDATVRLAEIALEHDEVGKAIALLDELQPIVEGGTWLPEDHAAMRARLAVVRHRCGLRERARADLDVASREFESARSQVNSVFLGIGHRPLAEAWARCGDQARALAIFRQAVTDAVVNPNSRPRAEDLVATCVAMALADVPPDAELSTRLRQVAAGLADPW
ncbi:MAG: hypothetical protein IPK26_16505 [Planctomycetes bacterium]|nr:hypothetical protein [Planctomycetota bacterium]